MGKKLAHKTGDIFSVSVAENEFIFGRILFDVNKQYIKKFPKGEQFNNYLDWFGKCYLIETYIGVFPSLDKVDFDKIAVECDFVANSFFRDDAAIVGHKEVNPKDVIFPEVLSTYNSQVYYSVGELNLPIDLSWEEYDKIKVCPCMGSGYWSIVETLSLSERKDLIDPDDIGDFYRKASDLRIQPELRKRLYEMIGENLNQTYYEMALKHGFDLARFYE